MNTNLAVNLIKRPAYAFIGLLAGDAALLLFLLQNAIRNRADLLAMHMGEPARQIPGALDLFVLYARLSFVGWLFVALPIALFLPSRFVTRLSWPLRVFIGAALGPLALIAILVRFDRERVGFPGLFRGTDSLWTLSILVSTVSFAAYVTLLRRERIAWTAKNLAGDIVAIAIFLVTLFFLPGLSYVTIFIIASPASLVVLGGYVGWLRLRRISRSLADMCGSTFALAVVCALFFILPQAPILGLRILLPSAFLWTLLKIASIRGATRHELPP